MNEQLNNPRYRIVPVAIEYQIMYKVEESYLNYLKQGTELYPQTMWRVLATLMTKEMAKNFIVEYKNIEYV